jgi:hypothetical protein
MIIHATHDLYGNELLSMSIMTCINLVVALWGITDVAPAIVPYLQIVGLSMTIYIGYLTILSKKKQNRTNEND